MQSVRVVDLYEEEEDSSYSDSDSDDVPQRIFKSPDGVAVGPDGVIYVADSRKHCIMTIKAGKVSIFAGQPGWGGCVDGPTHSARFQFPVGVAVGHDNTVYVCDQGNSRIRAIQNGVVTTFAGTYNGYQDGAAVSQSKFSHPSGICIANDSTLYVADHGNHAIRVIKNGTVSTLEGGTDLQCSYSVAVGDDGAVYVAQKCTDKISVIRDGICTTLAGGGGEGLIDGPADGARFNSPSSLTVAPDNTVYVSDYGNMTIRSIRDGVVSTLHKYYNYRYGEVGLSGITMAPENSLYVSESYNGRVFQLCGLPVADSLNLWPGYSVGTRKEISICGVSTHVHEPFVKVRCPKLLETNSSCPVYPADVVQGFVEFIYSNQIRLNTLPPSAILRIGSILHYFSFFEESIKCLERLRFLSEEQEKLTVTDLIELYRQCLDWKHFDLGRKTCAHLLQHHPTKIDPRTLPDLLNSQANAMELLCDMVGSQSDQLRLEAPEVPKKAKTAPLNVALSKLLDSKSGADFEISINGGTAMKCHSFVLYARWPYFRQMIDSNMKEAREKKLVLPNVDEDCGMHPVVLKALLEACYKGQLSQPVQKEFDPIMSSRVLGECALYLAGFDEKEPNATKLLTQFAKNKLLEGVNMENCIVLYERAAELGFDDLSTSTRKFIANNISSLKLRPESVKQITHLPWNLQAHILWHQLGITDPSTIAPTASSSSSAAFADDDDDNDEPPKKRRKTNAKASSGSTRTRKGR